MKKIVLLLIILGVVVALTSCGSSSKATSERRGLMMPNLSEMPKNKGKFKEVDYRKRNKKKNKARKKSSYKR